MPFSIQSMLYSNDRTITADKRWSTRLSSIVIISFPIENWSHSIDTSMISPSMFTMATWVICRPWINGRRLGKVLESFFPTCTTASSALGQTDLFRVRVTGVRTAYDKHQQTSESKGVKAHFQLDDNCLMTLDRVCATKIFFSTLAEHSRSFRWNLSSKRKKSNRTRRLKRNQPSLVNGPRVELIMVSRFIFYFRNR